MLPIPQFRLLLQLRRITYTLPLYLKNIQFLREFQVVHNLAYDAILRRDYLQVNRAMINLDNNTITLKQSVNQQREATSASALLIGTFLPQENNFKAAKNASTSKASLKPTTENFSLGCPKS